MNLSKDLISQFVKATKDTTTVKKESTVYGTVVKYNEKTYVKIDGSDLLTPAETLSSVEDGERVSIMIKDHTATITGNYTAPSASSIKVDGMDADLKANTASIKNLVAKNAEIENLVASKATIDDLQAANAEIDTLKSNYAEIETLVAGKASIGDLEAVNADIKSLKADKADIAHLEANYATIGSLNAVYADVTRLEANKADITDLTATNAVIEELKANKANISDLEANYATIKQLDATNANVTNLQAETANINKALIDKANVSDLTATNANVSNLQATKADITDLNAANANISTLTGNLADITTLVNGNLTSDNIQSMVITGDKFTVADAFIKDAMIDSVSANKINAGVINTNNVSIQSNDGSMLLQGNLQQFKDKNGKVRIQIGKDATGNFTFVLYDENGTGQLINQNGIQSSNAIADGLIVDAKVADNANIAGSKLDIDSVVTEVNNGTTSIKGTKIYLDDQKQSLNVAFNNMSTTVSGNTNTIESHTTSINTMNGKVTQLISDTTITKQDGTTTSLKDAYNATVDTVNSHTQTIGSLETNLSKVSTGQNKWLLEMFEKGSGISGNSPITIKDIMGKSLLKAILVNDSSTGTGLNLGDQYLGRATTYVYLEADYNWGTTATSDDGSTLYLNGAVIATLESCQATSVELPFKQGWNKITWVYIEGSGSDGWLFNPRLTSLSQIKNMNAYPMTNIDEVGNILDGDIKTVSSKQASLEQNLDGFKQTVSETYTTKTEFDNLSIGARNYYTKTCGLEILASKGTVVRDNSINGFILTANSDGKIHCRIKCIKEGNKYYTVSGYFKADTQCHVHMDVCDCTVDNDNKVVPTTYTKFSGTAYNDKVADDIYNFVDIESNNIGAGNKIYFKDFKVEEGQRATSWTPAPEDVNNAINTVDGKFSNYSTTSQMNSAINQKANEITSSVSQTYATKTALTTVDNKFANYSTTSAMNSAINQKANEITSSVSETYATKTSVTDVSNNLKNNYSTTSAMNSAIQQKANEITSSVSETYATKTALTTVDNKFANYSTTSAMNSAINQKSDAILSTVSSTYATKTSVTDVSNNLKNNYSTTSAMNSAINQKANEITSTVSNTYATKAALNTVDGKFANYSTTSAMNSAIQQKANEITSSVSETYATKTSLKATDDKFANYSTTSAMNSAINQKANEITSSVSQNYTTKADFNNLLIGGTNLARNTSVAYSSTISGENASNTWEQSGHKNWWKHGIKIKANEYITFSFDYVIDWSGCSQGATDDCGVGIGGSPNLNSYSYDFFVIATFKQYGGSNTQGHFVLTFKPTTHDGHYYAFRPFRAEGTRCDGAKITISNFKIERGQKATSWSPAPEDINAAISVVDGKFTNYSTTSQMNSAINQKANEITSSVSETYATKASLTTVDNKFANYSTTSAMNSAINQKANEITSTVSETYATKTSVTDVSNNLKNNYSTTSAMNSAINQKANEITSSVSETYATKTALSTVDNKFANYSTTSQMNSAIQQKSDSILSTVSNTYTTKTDFNKIATGQNKWLLEVFDRGNVTGTGAITIRDLVDKPLKYTRLINDGNTYWNIAETYLARLTTNVYLDADYSWTVGAKSDDGGTLYLNGQVIATTTVAQKDVTLPFKKGWNKITWVYNENSGDDGAVFATKISSLSQIKNMNAYPVVNFDEIGMAINNDLKANYSTTSSMNSAINQKANEITSTVSQTYSTKEELGNLKIGGTNLFVRSDCGDGYIGVDADNVGQYVPSSKQHQTMKTLVPTNGNTKLIYQVWNPNKTSNSQNTNRVAFFNSSKTFISNYTVPMLNGNEYQTSTINMPANTAYIRLGAIMGQNNDTVDSAIKIKFEFGNKATDWSPAPEDVDNSIATVDGKFASYSTTSQMNSTINQKANEITSTVSNTYATKAALNTVDGKFANYSTTSQMNSAIQQKSDAILSTVSQTYTTKTDFNNLSVGGRNYYTKTSRLEILSSKGTVARDNSINGFVLTADSSGNIHCRIRCIKEGNKYYTVSGYFKANTQCNVNIDVCDYGIDTKTAPTAYTKFSGTVFNYKEVSSTYNFVDIECFSIGAGNKVYFKDFKVEEGQKATSWSPAPEDIDASITAVDNKFNNYSTTSQMNSAINQKANEITSTVSSLDTKFTTNYANTVISSSTEFYLSTSNTTQINGSWSDVPSDVSQGTFLWSRTKNTKGDGSVSYTEPICVTDDTSDGYIIVLSRENQTIYCDANGNPI